MGRSVAFDQERAPRALANPVLELVVQRKQDPVRRSLGQILLDMGLVTDDELMRALETQSRQAGFLGDILIARDLVTEAQLSEALARQYRTSFFTQSQPLPDPRLIDRLGVQRCLRMRCLPWHRAGAVTVIACARPAEFVHHRAALESLFGALAMVVISEDDLHAIVLRMRRSRLKLWAETCVAEGESCRKMHTRWFGNVLCLAFLSILALAALAPLTTLLALTLVATFCLMINSMLKIAAAFAAHRYRRERADPSAPGAQFVRPRKPVVSILVPLHNEPLVVWRLINRLSRLTWPRELLDILLVVEEHDHATRAALAACSLPRWMRVIPVPDAPLKTKPRALNYAMLFARGAIIGVYDAEDAPEPAQIHHVVQCFQNGPPNLACVQGVLDFYNARKNWLSRCFAIEYATWFRVILPGMQRLGLAVPLGERLCFSAVTFWKIWAGGTPIM